MSSHDLLAVWESGLLLIGILAGWFYLRADYEVDSFRQEMFRLRDEMFDYASDGAISYDHPAYIQLRGLANGLIRFAHRMTLWRILVMFGLHLLLGIRRTPTFDADLERNIVSIGSPEVEAKMREFHKKIAFFMTWQLVRSSLVFWPLIVCVLIKHAFEAARVQMSRTGTIREAAESATVQKAIPTDWIEEQAIACA